MPRTPDEAARAMLGPRTDPDARWTETLRMRKLVERGPERRTVKKYGYDDPLNPVRRVKVSDRRAPGINALAAQAGAAIRTAQGASVAAFNELRQRERQQARGDFSGLIGENHRLREALQRVISEFDAGGKVWLPFDVIGAARAALERQP